MWDIQLRSLLLTNLNYYLLRRVGLFFEATRAVLCATSLEFLRTGLVRFTRFGVCARTRGVVFSTLLLVLLFDRFVVALVVALDVVLVVLRFAVRVVLVIDRLEFLVVE